MKIIFLLVITFVFSAHLKADELKSSNKKIILKFDDELVRGQLDMPEVQFLDSKKQAQFKKFIKFRQNFVDEVEKTKGHFNGR